MTNGRGQYTGKQNCQSSSPLDNTPVKRFSPRFLCSTVQTACSPSFTQGAQTKKKNESGQIEVNTDGVNVRTMFSGLAHPLESIASGHWILGVECHERHRTETLTRYKEEFLLMQIRGLPGSETAWNLKQVLAKRNVTCFQTHTDDLVRDTIQNWRHSFLGFVRK